MEQKHMISERGGQASLASGERGLFVFEDSAVIAIVLPQVRVVVHGVVFVS